MSAFSSTPRVMNLYGGLWSDRPVRAPIAGLPSVPQDLEEPPSPQSPDASQPTPPTMRLYTSPPAPRPVPDFSMAAALADGQGNAAPAGLMMDDGGEDLAPRWRNASPPRGGVCDDFVYQTQAVVDLTQGSDHDAQDDGDQAGDDLAPDPIMDQDEREREQELIAGLLGETATPTEPRSPQSSPVRSPYFGGGIKRRRISRGVTPSRPDTPQDHRGGGGGTGDESSAYDTDRVGSEGPPQRKRARYQNGGGSSPTPPPVPPPPDFGDSAGSVPPPAPIDMFGGAGNRGGSGLSTDCCRARNGSMLPGIYPPEPGDSRPQVWCFGCQWGARGHRPVDNDKIRDLTNAFTNLILQGSTSLENIAALISDQYRRTIRKPALAADQWLPDWPPVVVQRHIENMTEPRVVNALQLRGHIALLNRLRNHAIQVDYSTGDETPNLPVLRVLFQGMRELRELYRQVPKESFGYNENFRADHWAGGVLVHPSRVRQRGAAGPGAGSAAAAGAGFPGGPVASQAGRAGSRRPAVSMGGGDTGELRGPANDEDLVRRPIHTQADLSLVTG